MQRGEKNEFGDCMADEESRIVIVLTMLPDRQSATHLATLLVEQRLAACVNILSECTSVYRWKGNIETATEVPLMIKASVRAYAELAQKIRAHHPYELPEIVSLPVAGGLPAYLDWVMTQSNGA